MFQHVAAAVGCEEENAKMDRIKAIQDSGAEVEHYILRHGLTEANAFEVEAALIDFVGLDSLTNIMCGRYTADFGMKTTAEIIAQYEASVLIAEHPLILVNLNRLYRRDMSPAELYEASRKAWVVGKTREKAQYAIPHYRGLTREVYAIDAWQPSPVNGKTRWAFDGRLAPDHVRALYRYKHVKSYLKPRASNPIKYVNC